jgi:hypothetical protein
MADRLFVAPRLPALVGRDRQQRERRRKQHRVNRGPRPRRKARLRCMGVGISGEQHGLKEKHAGGPHRRRAAEPGQDQPGDQRLHQEQQKRGQEDRRRVQHRRLQILFASVAARPV